MNIIRNIILVALLAIFAGVAIPAFAWNHTNGYHSQSRHLRLPRAAQVRYGGWGYGGRGYYGGWGYYPGWSWTRERDQLEVGAVLGIFSGAVSALLSNRRQYYAQPAPRQYYYAQPAPRLIEHCHSRRIWDPYSQETIIRRTCYYTR